MSKSKVTSHILDTELGKPASGVSISLEVFEKESWRMVGEAKTDDDGRVIDWLKEDIQTGRYRISFDVEKYFSTQNRDCFYPSVAIEFYLEDAKQHYHVPLLLNAHGYSTYRGS